MSVRRVVWDKISTAIAVIHSAALGAILSQFDWSTVGLLDLGALLLLLFVATGLVAVIFAVGMKPLEKPDFAVVSISGVVVVGIAIPISHRLLEAWFLIPTIFLSWTFSSIIWAALIDKSKSLRNE